MTESINPTPESPAGGAITIEAVGLEGLDRYIQVPIAFWVTTQFVVEPVDSGLGGLRLVEVPVDPPYMKNYDLDESPADWARLFDVSRWVFFLAESDGLPVGGAAVAYDTPGINMLEGRSDLTVLWDLRVHPNYRGRGVGTRLFQAAVEWSRRRPAPVTQMKIETQTINVPACRFYARQGAVLRTIHHNAYLPHYPQETMLLWYLNLSSPDR